MESINLSQMDQAFILLQRLGQSGEGSAKEFQCCSEKAGPNVFFSEAVQVCYLYRLVGC